MTHASSADLFSNTETAFAALSDSQLRQAYWLFRILGQKTIVSLGPVMTDLAFKMRLPIQPLIRKTIFAHFCGGETIEQSMERVKHLDRFHIGTILDYAKEGEASEKDFDAVYAEIIRTIDQAAKYPAIPFAVFKPSGIASLDILIKLDAGQTLSSNEQAAFDRAAKRFDGICAHAFKQHVRIMIDAEESWVQDTVDDLAKKAMRLYNQKTAIVFNTVQLYRHDRLGYMQTMLEDAKAHSYLLGFKLVRGAYLEKEKKYAQQHHKPYPLNPSKEATDQLYDEALGYCLDHIERIALCAGTHNQASCTLLMHLMESKRLKPNDPRISFAQLLGMSDNISFNLAKLGYNVAKYVPYGKVSDLLPYLTRRAQENSSVLGQSSRELQQLEFEMQRRKRKA